jgi:hypothetical protein
LKRTSDLARPSARLCIAVAALLVPGLARAQSVPRNDDRTGPAAAEDPRDVAKERPGVVLIVRRPGDERVVARVRAELASSGWPSVELTPDSRDAQASLARLSSLVSAAAAVRVHAEAGAIEVWVAPPPGSPAAPVDTISVAGTRPDAGGAEGPRRVTQADDRVLALRATEALRARGLHLERHPVEEPTPEPTPPAEPPLPPKVVPLRAREPAQPGAPAAPLGAPRGRWLELAPGAALSPGGLTPAFDGWTSLRFDRSTWSAGALLLLPITDRRVAAAEGSAQLSLFMTGAFADVALLRGPVQMNAGVGVAAAISRMKGTAHAGYEGDDDTVWSTAPFARASAHVDIGSGWRLTAGAMLGAGFPRIAVYFAEREVASWGRPYFFVGTLGVAAPLLTWSGAR